MACSSASTAASGEEEKKEQKLIDAMFLCDEWKSSKGGLSTFNREFAINLAETTAGSMKIHCYVSNSDDRDREDAEQFGVNLIKARSVPGSADPLECLKFPPSQLPNPHLVIGHGRKLGSPAYFLTQITKCKWIQFVHVYCEDLGKYKDLTRLQKIQSKRTRRSIRWKLICVKQRMQLSPLAPVYNRSTADVSLMLK